MNRVSPFTYLVSGVLSAGIANTRVFCADNELLAFKPSSGSTCGEYMAAHQQQIGGYLIDANATVECLYCPISDTNKYLETVNISYADRWRNFGILWVYIVFNIGAALLVCWLARVPKEKVGQKKKE